MRELPIPFSPPMVRAVIAGTKTQTRRLVKPQPWLNSVGQWLWERRPGQLIAFHPELSSAHYPTAQLQHVCPYGAAGDRLWVREPWRVGKPHDSKPPRDIWPRPDDKGVTVLYEAGGWRDMGGRYTYTGDEPMPSWAGKYRPAMFMPRAFSRITLENTGVRVERLHAISAEDCIAEGLSTNLREHDAVMHLRDQFRDLWISTGGDWDANPWVWVIGFRRVVP